jgi:hypothetical protein
LYLSVRHAGTISSEFNNTERDMDKLEFQTNGANEHAARPAPQATFIDLGAVNSAVGSRATEYAPAPAPLAMSGIDIRIDLGGGVVLTIARR